MGADGGSAAAPGVGKVEGMVTGVENLVKQYEGSIERLADTVENIVHSVQRIFQLFRSQKETFVGLKGQTQSAVSPILDQGRDLVQKGKSAVSPLASRARENPVPFVLGTGLVVGGFFLLAYYMRDRGSYSSNARDDWQNVA
jgi:hypothetical protein